MILRYSTIFIFLFLTAIPLMAAKIEPDSMTIWGNKVTIKKSALEKEFLLQASIIPQIVAPAFNGLKSRVVYFKLHNENLYLMEANHGHTYIKNNLQNLILTSFPVLKNTETSVVFDFNKGMSNIFTSEDWRASDFNSRSYDTSFQNAHIETSFLREAKIVKSNHLSITQTVKVSQDTNSMDLVNAQMVEVKYYLTPYNPDPTFRSVAYGDFDQVGFFEVAPQINSTGGELVYATKFHSDKPIVFAVSANTPKEFNKAVKDGVLYWNKAFGKEVVKVIDAPVGVSAPDFNYNIVQWVEWDDAGSAYADAQMDPITGEILHAQVFMTSAFAFISKLRAQMLYQKLTDSKNTEQKTKRFTLKGFQQKPMCDFKIDKSFVNDLGKLLLSDATDEAYLKIAQDYVAHVVAHEIGHTLGLRHNFAGSLSVNYPLEKRDNLLIEYLKTKKASDNVVPSSSVMEYSAFVESIFQGDQLSRTTTPALSYDTKAIQTLYFGRKNKLNEGPLFCTDSHLYKSNFSDCNQGDVGSSPIEYSNWYVKTQYQELPYNIINAYAAAKMALFEQKEIPLEKVNFEPKILASRILSERQEVINLLTTKGRLLRNDRKFGALNSSNEELVNKLRMSYVEAEVEKYGGLSAILAPVSDTFSQDQTSRFNQLISNQKHLLSGKSPDDKPYKFSSDEVGLMSATAEAVFKKLQEELIKQDLVILGAVNPEVKGSKSWFEASGAQLMDSTLSAELLDILIARIDQYIFKTVPYEYVQGKIRVDSKKEEARIKKLLNKKSDEEKSACEEKTAKKDDKDKCESKKEEPVKYVIKTISVPKFAYKYLIRQMASTLFEDKKHKEDMQWGVVEKAILADKLEKALTTWLEVESFDKVKISDLSPNLAKWYLENKAILGNLK